MTNEKELPDQPWHAGEVALQRRLGVAGIMAERGSRLVRDHLIAQHREFYPLLRYVVLAVVDQSDDIWTSLRCGEPGFLQAVNDRTLHAAIGTENHDPSEAGLKNDAPIALLGIDLETKRRNRLNGRVHNKDARSFDIDIEQSFGNCPKYIRQRELIIEHSSLRMQAAPVRVAARDLKVRHIVERADTFFVGSYADLPDGNRQVDVSHRGGPPGFVHMDGEGNLVIPDYAGNRFFATLGNLFLNGHAGLMFIDFSSGDMLQMSGNAVILPDCSSLVAFPDAERLWRFTPRHIIHRPNALSVPRNSLSY